MTPLRKALTGVTLGTAFLATASGVFAKEVMDLTDQEHEALSDHYAMLYCVGSEVISDTRERTESFKKAEYFRAYAKSEGWSDEMINQILDQEYGAPIAKACVEQLGFSNKQMVNMNKLVKKYGTDIFVAPLVSQP